MSTPEASTPPQAAASGPRARLAGAGWWPWAVLTLGALLLASDVIAGRMAPERAVPPFGLAFWRVAGAAIVLTPFAAAEILRNRAVLAAHWRVLALLGLSVSVFGGASLYAGLSMTTAMNGGVVSTAQSAVTVFWGWLLFRDRIGRHEALGLVVAAIGVLVVVARGSLPALLALEPNPGDLLVFVGVSGFAAYVVILRRAPHGLSAFALVCVVSWVGAAFNAPLYAAEALSGTPFPFTWESLAMVAWVSIVVSVLAVGCLTVGTRRLGSYVAGTFNYVRTVFVAVLAIAVLGEAIAPYHLAGGLLIGYGVYLMTATRRRRAPAPHG